MRWEKAFYMLLDYVYAMGANVTIAHYSSRCPDTDWLEWTTTPRIVLNSGPERDLKDLTLSLIHEAGHLMDWIHLGRPGPNQLPKALAHHEHADKNHLDVYWGFEARAINNMITLNKEIGLLIPKHILEIERRYDIWVYTEYCQTGKHYPSEQRKAFLRQLTQSLSRGRGGRLSYQMASTTPPLQRDLGNSGKAVGNVSGAVRRGR